MPTEAEEDWMMAVNSAPAKMPSSGLLNRVIRLIKASDSRRGNMEELIMSMPKKRMPRPAMICP